MTDNSFRRMADIIKPAHTQNFMLDIFEVSEDEARMMHLRDMINGRHEYDGFTAGKYARLSHRNPDGTRGATIMSDTWMEQKTNIDVVAKARGDVLIGGLGIGMILLVIQDWPEVESVTVVEKNAEVIELVKPQLPLNSKVTIVQGDVFTYKPTKTFDVIYMDIWDTISGDNYDEMKKLHRRYGKYKKQFGWVDSWRSIDCRRKARGIENYRR